MDPILDELIKIRKILEHLTAKPALLRRGWVIVFEVAAFISAIVSIIIYVVDYLWR